MFPHERSLVSHFQGKPFALLGVNADPGPETVLRLQNQGTVTWRSWCDGGAEGGGQIAERWGVEMYPTLFLIDAQGVIRYSYTGAPSPRVLERNLSDLIAEAEGKGPAS